MGEDDDLMAKTIGRPALFADVFDLHARVVAVFAARRVGDDAAQDVMSETFLVAFRRRADYDSSLGSVRSWLLGIAATLVRKHRAAEATQWRAIIAAERHATRMDDGGLVRADERLDARGDLRGLAERIAALADGDRDVLLMYAWGELSYEAIAAALAVPVGTVRSRLHRVRRLLSAAEKQKTAFSTTGSDDG